MPHYTAAPETFEQMDSRLNKIKTIWDPFDMVQSEIEDISPDGDLQDNERQFYETKYFKLEARMKAILRRQSRQDTPISNSSADDNINSINIRLPAIDLSTFDGKFNTYQGFQTAFSELININPNLSTIQKYDYLQSTQKCQRVVIQPH